MWRVGTWDFGIASWKAGNIPSRNNSLQDVVVKKLSVPKRKSRAQWDSVLLKVEGHFCFQRSSLVTTEGHAYGTAKMVVMVVKSQLLADDTIHSGVPRIIPPDMGINNSFHAIRSTEGAQLN